MDAGCCAVLDVVLLLKEGRKQWIELGPKQTSAGQCQLKGGTITRSGAAQKPLELSPNKQQQGLNANARASALVVCGIWFYCSACCLLSVALLLFFSGHICMTLFTVY